MKNPKIPAIHFNTRFIVTSKEWFGGGMDVTPSHEDKKEKLYVHNELKKVCYKIKKIIKIIKNGVISIFIYLIEMKQEELVEFFLIMKLKIGVKILNLLESLVLLL